MDKTGKTNRAGAAHEPSRMSRRQAREQEVIALMIRLYCKGKKHERGAASVCPACQELTEYAAERLRRCPVVESRRFCQFCTVHCYRDAMRAQITEVMRYSGPKMLWHKPLYALRHLREPHKHRRQNAAG